MKAAVELLAFNRGRVSRWGLGRVDIKRISLSAEVMTNFVPRVLGSMMLRPGLQYITPTLNNAKAIQVPFVFKTDDTALLELTSQVMRVRVDDVLITRPTVTATVANGEFTTDLTSWTDADEAGGTSSWVTGGYLSLIGTRTNAAIRTQEVLVPEPLIEHALRILIQRGPVTLRIGSTAGGDEYITETSLGTGHHSIAFTPSASFHIQLSNRRLDASLVDSVTVEAAGVVQIPTAWLTADLPYVRYENCQSADVIFVACKGFQQRKIERRSTRSWSVVLYEPEDGPFRIENVGPITITPSAITGDITLTASKPLFRSTQVGGLFRVISQGQNVSSTISAENNFTNSIKVTGVGNTRGFTVSLTGTWVATVTLQRSFDEGASWIDVTTYTAETSTTYDDGLDNQIIHYRIGVKTGDFTSGSVVAALSYSLGSITGVTRLTAYTSSTIVSARVVKDLGGTTATDQWAEGLWSTYRGFPSTGALYEGRLWWAGKDKIVGSISDAFDSFDPDTVGDSGPINRSIGSGPVDDIGWLLPMQRLLMGTQSAEVSARSTSFDEPLTPTNFNIKEASTQGSALVSAVKVDSRGVFVQRSGVRVYELAYSFETNDYASSDLTQLIPEMGLPGIVKIAVQRQPDTRIHCVRSDGTVALAVIEKVENVLCWLDITTDGIIEDVAILPGSIEDKVYYTVKRTINGSTVRYLEKWALETECRGSTLSKIADSFVSYTGGQTSTISNLDHLEGEEVIAWGDGTDLSPDDLTYTVTDGKVTLSRPVSNAIVGLPYTAQWKNAKIAHAITQVGSISQIGFVLTDAHAKGLKFGRDFDHLDPLPSMKDGVEIPYDTVHTSFDTPPVPFPGQFSSDPRVCLEAKAPRCVTVLAAVASVEKYAKT